MSLYISKRGLVEIFFFCDKNNVPKNSKIFLMTFKKQTHPKQQGKFWSFCYVHIFQKTNVAHTRVDFGNLLFTQKTKIKKKKIFKKTTLLFLSIIIIIFFYPHLTFKKRYKVYKNDIAVTVVKNEKVIILVK